MQFGTFSGGGLGFGVSFTLRDQFTRVEKKIQGSMARLEAGTERMASKVNAAMAGIQGGIVMMGSGIALLAPIFKGLNVAEQFENYELQLSTLLKSGDKARKLLADIKKDALDNPVFETDSLMKANSALIATGKVDPIGSREIVNDLSNIIAGAGGGDDELRRMAINLQQIGNAGKASAIDLRQFALAGIPIYNLIAESMGKTTEEVRDMDISLEMLAKAFKAAGAEGGMFEGALENAAKGYKGLKARLGENIDFTLMKMAEKFEPIYKKMLSMASDLLEGLQEFMDTPIGKFITQIAGLGLALAALTLIAVGVVMVITALAGPMAAAFTAVMPVIAGIALLAAKAYILYRLLNSTNDALMLLGVTIAIFMGPIGWLIAGIVLIVRAWKSFESLMNGESKPLSGIAGVLQKIGGIMWAVGEIWSSATEDGFAMSGKLHDALQEIGILDLVISIGTYIVRLKNFLRGMKEGFMIAFDVAKDAIKSVLAPFEQMITNGEGWSDWLDRNTSDMDYWKEAGKKAAYAMAIGLGVVVAVLLAIAVATIIAFLPQIIMIGLIVAAVYMLIKYWDEVKLAMIGIGIIAVTAFSPVVQLIGVMLKGLLAMYDAAVALGYLDKIDLMENNRTNIEGMADGTLMQKVQQDLMVKYEEQKNKIELEKSQEPREFNMQKHFAQMNAPDYLKNLKVGTSYPIEANTMEKEPLLGKENNNLSLDSGFDFNAASQKEAEQKAAQVNVQNSEPTIIDKSTQKLEQINVTVNMDGDEVANKVIEKQELDSARSN